MSKIARYLQEHIGGQVSTSAPLLAALSRDASVLSITPEMVLYPRITNDIRKVARFAWQLAEKGHALPLTVRGAGTDQTGAAIGRGIIVDTSSYMNAIFEFDAKQKLIRAQPGVTIAALHAALRLQGMTIPSLPMNVPQSTLGGAVANRASSSLSGRYGDTGAWVQQIEVVLANGDVLQTERLSKRDLSRKKGLQTFEGEIYRTIDNIIEDNKELIAAKLTHDGTRDNVGYGAVSQVKQKDGSFDLAPLLIGSQGTLGIVSELIMKADFSSLQGAAVAAAFPSREVARDMLDKLRGLQPASLDYFDGELFAVAGECGRSYSLCSSIEGTVGAVLVMSFDDFNQGARARKLKRALKLLEGAECHVESANGAEAADIMAITQVTTHVLSPDAKDTTAPSLFDGVYVPRERFEDFQTAVTELAKKHTVTLPLWGRALEDIYYTRPSLQLKKVGDKQKIFKLLDEYSDIVSKHHGHMIAEAGEGRMLSRFAHKELDDDVQELFRQIKQAFDPHGILNPEVKQPLEVRQLVSYLAPHYDPATRATIARY